MTAGGIRKGLLGLLLVATVLLLIVILLPVPFGGKESGMATACLSNMKQLSTATLSYAEANDETFPITVFDGRPSALGWAGKVAPGLRDSEINERTRSPRVFHCFKDGSAPISYGMNANLAELPKSATHGDPERSVLLFEVAEARLGGKNELGGAERLAPVGDGGYDGLRDSLDLAAAPFARYATGVFANTLAPPEGMASRHGASATLSFVDGHAKRMLPLEVSAGANAPRAGEREMGFGCRRPDLPATERPCADGTAKRTRRFTFSLR